MSVRIGTRDPGREAYRITTAHGDAWLPECLIDGLRPGHPGHPGRPSHQEAYEWIARNAPRIERAVTARTRGQTPPRPFDLIDLRDEPPLSSFQKYSQPHPPQAPTPEES